MKITASPPEVNVHVLAEEPTPIRVSGEDFDLEALYVSLRDGTPASPLARVRDGDKVLNRRVPWDEIPEPIRARVTNAFAEIMLGASLTVREVAA